MQLISIAGPAYTKVLSSKKNRIFAAGFDTWEALYPYLEKMKALENEI